MAENLAPKHWLLHEAMVNLIRQKRFNDAETILAEAEVLTPEIALELRALCSPYLKPVNDPHEHRVFREVYERGDALHG